jgi:hypothetical protein
MQYTIRNISKGLDQALRRKAREAKKSLNQVAVDALAGAVGLSESPGARHRDLGDVAGTWQRDETADAALAEQRRIEPTLWR